VTRKKPGDAGIPVSPGLLRVVRIDAPAVGRPLLGRVGHLRPAGAVDCRYSSSLAHLAVGCTAFFGVPPLSVSIRPRALAARPGRGKRGSCTWQVRSIHCGRQVVGNLRIDGGLAFLVGHLFFPSTDEVLKTVGG
jgi:hypothetical protein